MIESATSEMVSIADTVRQASATVSRLGTQSAQEIAAMIERIQADANATVSDMKAGVEQVDIGVERNHGQTMQTSEAAANIKQLIVVLRKTIAHFRL